MGTQQLLLVALGVTVVGVAIAVGLSLFQSSAVSTNRDQVISHLQQIAAEAIKYYKKPSSQGGGNNSYAGFQIPLNYRNTSAGRFTISNAGNATRIIFQGIGVETGDNGRASVRYRLTVTSTGSLTLRKMN